jgi:hypothetical protein
MGLIGLGGLIHVLTSAACRVVGVLLGRTDDGERLIIRVTETYHLRIKFVLDGEDWEQLVDQYVVAEVRQSWLLPPTIFKIRSNFRVVG